MSRMKKPQFPKRFLWGASISAHQVDGSPNSQWAAWEQEQAKSHAARAEYHYKDLAVWSDVARQTKTAKNYLSSEGVAHRAQYKADITLLKKMQLNAFRFSLDWSRIEPSQGIWDAAEIEYCKNYVAELKAQGIEPIVTLFHFTVPAWFSELGGFEKRGNVAHFVHFAEKIMNELGSSVRYIVTINEPGVYAAESYLNHNWPPARSSKRDFVKVVNNLLYAHKKTSRALRAMNRKYKLGIAHNSSYVYPGDDAWLSRASAWLIQYASDDLILSRVRRHSDYIGVNYYFSQRVYGYRVHNEDRRLSDLGWDMHPDHLEYVLERLHRKYKLPLIVTENGLADQDDEQRTWWLMKTMVALSNALEQGVDVRGYMHWSLLDNFEWAHGWWPKFGLFSVDRETMKRTARPSAVWWMKFLKSLKS